MSEKRKRAVALATAAVQAADAADFMCFTIVMVHTCDGACAHGTTFNADAVVRTNVPIEVQIAVLEQTLAAARGRLEQRRGAH